MISEIVYITFMSYLLEGEEEKCAAIVEHLLEETSNITELTEYLISRSCKTLSGLLDDRKIDQERYDQSVKITEQLKERLKSIRS